MIIPMHFLSSAQYVIWQWLIIFCYRVKIRVVIKYNNMMKTITFDFDLHKNPWTYTDRPSSSERKSLTSNSRFDLQVWPRSIPDTRSFTSTKVVSLYPMPYPEPRSTFHEPHPRPCLKDGPWGRPLLSLWENGMGRYTCLVSGRRISDSLYLHRCDWTSWIMTYVKEGRY